MSVFGDERILSVAKRFVTAADEVWRLQRGGDAECRFFQRAVNRGELITDNGTRQGIYVFSPAGVVLARVNSLNADRVLQMLEEGWAAFEALPKAEHRLDDDIPLTGTERWEGSRPRGGLHLTRIARDLPSEGRPDGTRSERWNRDSLWFAADEIAELRGATEEWAPVPEVVTRRLGCFALVDNVYGQCIPFGPEDLRTAELEFRRAESGDGRLVLEFRGHTLAVEDGEWTYGDNLWEPSRMHAHAMETFLLGSAVLDTEADSFIEFELVALGRRSGYTELNSRRHRPEPGGIGFWITLDREEWSPAPTYLALYEGDWIDKPRSGRELRKR